MPFEEQTIVLYAALNGFLDEVGLAFIKQFEMRFLDYVRKQYRAEILDSIKKSGELSSAVENKLKEVITEYKSIK